MMIDNPFASAKTVIGVASHEFLKIGSVPIYFQEDWKAGIGGGLWSTGLAMAKYLQTKHAAQQLDALTTRNHVSGLNILELGSGNGLLAACWMALAQNKLRQIVITDTKEHLPLIERTLCANPHLLPSSATQETITPQVHVLEHEWGVFQDDIDTNFGKENITMAHFLATGRDCAFDLIVGSDVAYREELYDPLIASLKRLASPQTVILLGCTMSDTTPEFFDRLRNEGYVYQRLADHLLESEYRGRMFGLFVVQKRPMS